MDKTETFSERLVDNVGNLHNGIAKITKYADGSEMIRYVYLKSGEPMLLTWTSRGNEVTPETDGLVSEQPMLEDSLLAASSWDASRKSFLNHCLHFFQW